MVTFLEIAFPFIAVLIGTKYMFAYSLRNRILDIPNERSSHRTPVPRGGGLVFVFSILAGSLYLYCKGSLTGALLAALCLGGGSIACVGWIDDRLGLRARTRFAIHCLASLFTIACIGYPAILPIGNVAIPWGFGGAIFFFLAIAWIINSYNFMDGIDGLAAGEAVIVGIAGAALCSKGNTQLCIIIAGSAFGFLCWNWPPAKIFMGDVGSGVLGFIFAALWLSEATNNPNRFYVFPILLAVFIVDSTITLLWRMIRGEKWYAAHCCHVYQVYAAKAGHQKVTLTLCAITLLWLTPLAWLSLSYPSLDFAFAIIAYLPLVGIAVFVHKTGSHFSSLYDKSSLTE